LKENDMKTTLAVLLALGMTGPAIAGDAGATDEGRLQQNRPNMMTSEDMEGRNVTTIDGQTVGKVDAMVVAPSTGQQMAIIDLEGDGEDDKDISVPINDLQVAEDGESFIVTSSLEQLRAQPGVNADDFDRVGKGS
jgi:sporulation protein YlmC with PRC-barrel domain